ncbi:MAG: UDP-N-acetylmuramoyl-L-alanine--D-glutamate ligase [Gammaproteobacteria bacterium]|nr:UDP-N-acetylmuramoyl-L-alanine--D-glutamate ligase [Gammaproteobacteria bacterium]
MVTIDNKQRPYTLVVGLGITGVSVVRHLVRQGFDAASEIVVVDSRAQPPALAEFKQQFPDTPVHTGAFDEALFLSASRVVVSPGVAMTEAVIQSALAQGVEALGDIELFAREVGAPVVAITGSNGKSTVTTLVGEMAKRAGLNVAVGGNLGTPALDLLTQQADLYVLELSSFQLETVYNLQPVAAVVLNVSSDHMDRYDGIEHYSEVKRHVYNQCKVAVINRDDARVCNMAAGQRLVSGFTLHEPDAHDFGLREIVNETGEAESWLCKGQHPLIRESELKIGGRHNTANALAALALGEAASLPLSDMLEALREFKGLPHRTQWVAEKHGVVWYNDSKGTNVGATEAAIAGLIPPGVKTGGKLILILGGQGKEQDFSPLKAAVKDKVRMVVLMGQDADKIEQALDAVVPVIHARNMQDAVQQCAAHALAGDAVLLSPACASFDMFRGYTHRGEVFSQLVEALP